MTLSLLAACAGDQSSGGPLAPREPLGRAAVSEIRYVLSRVDGSSVPRRLCPDGIPTILAGRVVLRSDNRFTAAIRYQTGSTKNTAEASGTYTVSGNTVTLTGSNGLTATATLNDARTKLAYVFSYCDPPSRHRFLFVRQ